MALTFSHVSALDIVRQLRTAGQNIREMDPATFAAPTPWKGKRWTMREFQSENWRWGGPTKQEPFHVLAPPNSVRIRYSGIYMHYAGSTLPPRSIMWLDAYASAVCPELLFLQMATVLSFPMLVLLGYELCGYFTRMAEDPREGPVTDHVPPATNVESISRYLSSYPHGRGHNKAKRALELVSDGALSAPEAVLATIYSLPTQEQGYGMGPVTLNTKVDVSSNGVAAERINVAKSRYPDIMFPFAPVGINYDGADHLDLAELAKIAKNANQSSEDARSKAYEALDSKLVEIRKKVVDDIMRDRQLLAKGKVVLRATKEDVRDANSLDYFTLQLLDVAHCLFNADVSSYRAALEDTMLSRERQELLEAIMPSGKMDGSSHGKM